MKKGKITSDKLKTMINDITAKGRVARDELIGHGCPKDSIFVWKRIAKRKINISKGDDDFSFLLPLAGEDNAEGWVHSDFVGAKTGYWVRYFNLVDVKTKTKIEPDEELDVPDACMIFITDEDDAEVMAWFLNVD